MDDQSETKGNVADDFVVKKQRLLKDVFWLVLASVSQPFIYALVVFARTQIEMSGHFIMPEWILLIPVYIVSSALVFFCVSSARRRSFLKYFLGLSICIAPIHFLFIVYTACYIFHDCF